MKKLLSILVISFSMPIIAAETCRLDLKVVAEHPSFSSVFTNYIESGYNAKVTRSWEDCFEFAIEEVKKLKTIVGPYSANHVIRNRDGESEKRNLTFDEGYLFMTWTFDDAAFFDSYGLVTKYTKRSLPTKGDARANSAGTLLIQ
jgi:hypothetical protein